MYASRNALSFVDSQLPDTLTTCSQQALDTLNIGIVGPSRSSTAEKVASLYNDVTLPIISYSATSPKLGEKDSSQNSLLKFSNFYRTVPSDSQQMSLISDIL